MGSGDLVSALYEWVNLYYLGYLAAGIAFLFVFMLLLSAFGEVFIAIATYSIVIGAGIFLIYWIAPNLFEKITSFVPLVF